MGRINWFLQGMAVEWLAQLLFGGGGGIWVMFATLEHLPTYAVVLLSIFSFIIVFALVGIITKVFWGKDMVRFYRTRDDLKKDSRTLKNMINNYREIWALWISATEVYNDKTLFRVGHIKQLILLNPYGEVIEDIEKYGFGFKTSELAPLIKQATVDAESNGAKVKWLDFIPFISLTIGEPEQSNTEVQIEYAMANMKTGERPSCLVQERKYPEVIKRITNSFKTYWEQARWPTDVKQEMSNNN